MLNIPSFCYLLDGKADITLSGKTLQLKEGEMIVMLAKEDTCFKNNKEIQDDASDDEVLRYQKSGIIVAHQLYYFGTEYITTILQVVRRC
jgi:glyoxylate utilization-related uncharacterized protein